MPPGNTFWVLHEYKMDFVLIFWCFPEMRPSRFAVHSSGTPTWKNKALSLTVSASSYYLKLTEIEKGVGVHCERVACRAAVSFSSPCCLWYCCSVGKHLEACCLIIPGAQSAQFNIHSGHRGKMLWLTVKGLSDIAVLMLYLTKSTHGAGRGGWMDQERDFHPGDWVLCPAWNWLLYCSRCSSHSVFWMVDLFIGRITQKLLQGFTQNFWVSAQTRPHKVLVRIQIKGWLQELFLTFFSFVRQGIYHGIMHRSWRKYSGVLRWLVWVKGAFGTWLRNVLF